MNNGKENMNQEKNINWW